MPVRALRPITLFSDIAFILSQTDLHFGIIFIKLLLKKSAFSEASIIAVQVSKDKDFFRLWIESVASLLQEVYYAGLATERIGQRDLLEDFEKLAQTVSRSRLVRTINAVGRLTHDLQFNVNRQLALEAMFVALSQA